MDLLDIESVKRFLAESSVDAVIHCAARVGGIQANIDDPVGFLFDNSMINLNLIRCAAEAGIEDLLYLGSSCMYPRDYRNPLREEYLLAAPLEPTNEGYALGKIVGAKLCEYYSRRYGLHYKTIIPCNLYGRYDHFDPVSSHLIPALLLKLHRAAVEGRASVEVWGDGSARREFLFADDLAEFLCGAIGRLESLPQYLNVGFGQDYTVKEYYEVGKEVVGYSGSLVFDPSKPTGMQMKLMDSALAAQHGWAPSTSTRDGITICYRYFLDHFADEAP